MQQMNRNIGDIKRYDCQHSCYNKDLDDLKLMTYY